MAGSVAYAWKPPAAFAEYALLHPLGRGGMGHVYLARDTLLERLVAIKFMHRHRDAVARERFVVEARAAARLQHPNVVAVYRIGEVDGRPFIVSEYVAGDSLAAVATPMPWRDALDVGRDLARGLAAAHAHGVLHRDIKPANAIRTTSGVVKLLDFGLAKLAVEVASPSSGRSGAADPGSWDTPSPSSGRGEIDRAAPRMSTNGMLAPTQDRPQITEGSDAILSARSLASPATFEPPAREALPSTLDAPLTKGPLPSTLDAPPAKADLPSTLDAPRAEEPTLEPTIDPEIPGNEASEPLDSAPRNAASPAPLTRHGAVMGTPGYMAPEAWRGEPATARSDVYSMGALLYYLCTGEEPHATVPLAQLAKVTAERDVPPVATRAKGIDPAFAAVIDRCLSRDASARLESGAALLDALESIGARTSAAPEGNPYRGLLPFDAEHRALFFGRGADIRAVVELLRATPFVVVAGQSGVGKSSLCRAGALPLVAEGGFRDDRRWETRTMLPGRAPMTALRAALADLIGDLDPAGKATDPRALAAVLLQALGTGRGLVIFIDQLEEVLTLSDTPQIEAFCAFVADLVRASPPGVRVLATARGDYFTRLAELPVLGPAVERAFHMLRPMGRDAIREAIMGPARAAGAELESDLMVDELADAGVGGGLPLLQFALANLWDARDESRLTRAALSQIGGVEGALARHADEVIAGMAAPVRAAARGVLLRLVTLERTRGRRTARELADDDAGRSAIEALVRGRLVVARDEDEGEAGFAIAHEALLTRWDTLRRWLDASDETRAIRERVSVAAAEWDKLGRSGDALLRGQRLTEARRLDGAEMSSRERDFVARSLRASRRQFWLRAAGIAALPLIAISVYSFQAAAQRREVNRRVAEELLAGNKALSQARELEGTIADQRRRAFEAFDKGETDAAESVWTEALTAAAKQDAILTDAAVALEHALALDPQREESRRQMARVLFEHALAAERDHKKDQAHDLVQRLAVYDDGSLQAEWSKPATLTLTMSPPGATGTLAEYRNEPGGRRSLQSERPIALSGDSARLSPGSYLITLRAPGRVEVRYPVELRRGESLSEKVALPGESGVAAGFVYVPEGRFWFGTIAAEEIRKWQSATPAHFRRTPAFLIARRETTFAEWIEFVEAQPPEQRDSLLPVVTSGFWGTMSLRPAPAGGAGWELTVQPTQHAYLARTGEKLRYLDRERNTEVDWTRMPVTGVSWNQIGTYFNWLSRTGRVSRARPCREDEWERAARGADLRSFPHGDSLSPTDANFDETYGRKARAFGLDEVGSYPVSQSPFGLDDMVGNCFELVASVRVEGEILMRGGGYYYDAASCQATNRNVIQPTDQAPTLGFRVCADPPEDVAASP